MNDSKGITDITTVVWCRLQFVGFHKWKDAKGKQAFLRHVHRHVFHVQAEVEVKGMDREVEFIALKDEIQKYVYEKYAEKTFDASCEQIAYDLLETFGLCRATVSEDSENGATVSRCVYGPVLRSGGYGHR